MMGRFLAFLVARGWALGGGIAAAGIALWIQPPYPIADQGWPLVTLFAIAAVLLLGVGFWPHLLTLRASAVTMMVAACSWRAWGNLFLAHDDMARRAVGTVVWLLVAYWTFLLGMVTWGPVRDRRR